jgi:spore germination cell wall hydrolase CwlJ-like protein
MDVHLCVDVTFLALVVWREARGEPRECQAGVACSILNRVDRSSWWGKSILSVVTKKWQYSSMTDPHDRQLTTWPREGDPSWEACLQIAFGAIDGRIKSSWPCADSYYDVSIPAPTWATPETFVGQIGRIRFYNTDHDVEATA